MSEPPIPVRRHEQYAIRMLILVPLHAFPKEGSLRGRRLKGGDSFQGRRFAIDDGLCVSSVKTAINSLKRYDIKLTTVYLKDIEPNNLSAWPF